VAKKDKAKPGETPIAKNRRATYDYELGDRFEAGLVLIGSEVKVLRSHGTADLTDSWISVRSGEAWLEGMNIPMLVGAAFGHIAKHPRKLLLHRAEIDRIARALEREGMTATATRLYWKDGHVKAEVALARGKKQHDRRESVKEREADQEARAAMARGRRRE
jgi:SsrA-binding protein